MVNTKDVCVVPEIDEHAFYLMQWLQIDTESYLVFCDQGANAHVGDGRMAMKQKFKVISTKPTSLAVVGGGGG